jgi:hypothetical protein
MLPLGVHETCELRKSDPALQVMAVPLILWVGLLVAAVFLYLRRKPSASVKADGYHKDRYERRYASVANTSLPSSDSAKGSAHGVPTCKFLLTAKQHLQRDYVLLIDRSASMNGPRWAEAESAVRHLAPYVCKFDPDGITLYFFDHEYIKVDNVKSAQDVTTLFHTHRPRGSTNLALALHAAFDEHFQGSRGATTVLVVTDGAPDSEAEVRRVIVKAARSIERDSELSVSFIQIGKDTSASRFLEQLDDSLTEAPFDIVDTVKANDAKSMSFNELIARSIYD